MKYILVWLFVFTGQILYAQLEPFSVKIDTCLVFVTSQNINQNTKSQYQIKGRLDLHLHRMYYGDTTSLQALGNRETDEKLTEYLSAWSDLCESENSISCKIAQDSAFYQDTMDMNYFSFTSEKDTVGKLIVLQIESQQWGAFSDYHEHHFYNYVFYPKEKRQLTYTDLVDTLHERALAEFVCNAYAAQLIDMEYSEEDKKLIARDYANDSYNLLNNFKVTGSSVIFYLSSETDYFSQDYAIEVKIADFPNSFTKKFKKWVGL